VRTAELVAVVAQPGETLETLAATWLGDPARSWEIATYNGVDAAAPGRALVIPLLPSWRGGLTPERYQTVPVLAYGRFGDREAGPGAVSREAFAAQMDLLAAKGYRVVGLREFADFLAFRGQLPEKAVVITIDGAWRGAYDVAFPILRSHGFAATLFVATKLVSGGAQTLSWQQVREMAVAGIDVQCQTVTYRSLALQRGERLAAYAAAITREVDEATRTIEEQVGRRPQFFAYPYGETNGVVIALLRARGYRGAFTLGGGADPFFAPDFRLGRSPVFGDASLEQFERLLVTSGREALR
jgi:peptidoglycan/xylan/chitin deacetylase (PgdA/CDA1 family)